LTNSGKVYSWGNGDCGELNDNVDGGCGQGTVTKHWQDTPFEVTTQGDIKDKNIIEICAGMTHTLFLGLKYQLHLFFSHFLKTNCL